jgi:hypothetical protein
MKKVILGLVFVLISMVAAAAQTKDEANFMAMEKQAWDAFGKGDGKFFETFLADEGMVGTDAGFSSKAQTVKDIGTKPCELKSYEFSNFKVIMLDKNTALATYAATQDGACGGQAMPKNVIASTVYVKRKGKWMGILHQESAVQPMPSK